MKLNIFMFLYIACETTHDPQKGSTNIVLLVICGSIIGNNSFNSVVLFPIHPSGIDLFLDTI